MYGKVGDLAVYSGARPNGRLMARPRLGVGRPRVAYAAKCSRRGASGQWLRTLASVRSE